MTQSKHDVALIAHDSYCPPNSRSILVCSQAGHNYDSAASIVQSNSYVESRIDAYIEDMMPLTSQPLHIKPAELDPLSPIRERNINDIRIPISLNPDTWIAQLAILSRPRIVCHAKAITFL
jgi:hypothetical protein